MVCHIDTWVALREKVPNVLSRCHTKTHVHSATNMGEAALR